MYFIYRSIIFNNNYLNFQAITENKNHLNNKRNKGCIEGVNYIVWPHWRDSINKSLIILHIDATTSPDLVM